MKIQLPLENWADLLPFVPRRQLVALLFKLGDSQFAAILQFCLNEVGHITLGHLLIRAPKESYAIDGPILEVTKFLGWFSLLETPMPDEPIPKNVHNFSSLTFRYFDSSVLNFLQKFHQHKNALLANVDLSIQFTLPIVRLQPVLTEILPLIGDNINSLRAQYSDLLGCSRLLNNNVQCSGNNDEFSELVTTMLTRTRILSIRYSTHLPLTLDWCCRWLYAARMDGRPRMLSTEFAKGEALDFIDLIKKDFLMAKHPVTFFIRMQTWFLFNFENIYLENAKTNENLLMVKKYNRVYLISRFPMAANGAEWIQTYGQEILEFPSVDHDRIICLDYLDKELKCNNTNTG